MHFDFLHLFLTDRKRKNRQKDNGEGRMEGDSLTLEVGQDRTGKERKENSLLPACLQYVSWWCLPCLPACLLCSLQPTEKGRKEGGRRIPCLPAMPAAACCVPYLDVPVVICLPYYL